MMIGAMSRYSNGGLRLGYLFLLIIVTLAYAGCAYASLYLLPLAFSGGSVLSQVHSATVHATLVIDSENSIRAGAVTLLTGSSLGIAGLVAFLSFGASRRDAEHRVRSSQDELFTKSLEVIDRPDSASAVGAVSLLGSVANARPDLREAAASALFTLARRRIHLSAPLTDDVMSRAVDDLGDRDCVAAAALKAIALVPTDYLRERTPGVISERALEGCDLRGWKIAGVHFVVVSFARSYLWNSKLVDCVFEKCLFVNCDWSGANLIRVQFIECDMTYTNLMSGHGSDVLAKGCKGVDRRSAPDWLSVH
jgi:hypothetical protein